VVVAVAAEADEVVEVVVVAVGAIAGDTPVVAVEDTVVGEEDTEDATGGEWMRSIAIIRLILRHWSRFGSVL